MTGFSKESQLARSPGNRRCPTSGRGKGVCDCRPCIGRRSQAKGRKRQREARKQLERSFGSAGMRVGHEEAWRLAVRAEVKSGKQVESLTVRFLAAEAQSEAARARGDSRPFVMVASPDGGPQLLCMRLDALPAILEATR